ncbi:MAG TPA: hypothetical protein VIE37_12935, partial [Methylomirabilota bacterium]
RVGGHSAGGSRNRSDPTGGGPSSHLSPQTMQYSSSVQPWYDAQLSAPPTPDSTLGLVITGTT